MLFAAARLSEAAPSEAGSAQASSSVPACVQACLASSSVPVCVCAVVCACARSCVGSRVRCVRVCASFAAPLPRCSAVGPRSPRIMQGPGEQAGGVPPPQPAAAPDAWHHQALLDYEQQLAAGLIQEDALCVLAAGLGWQRLLAVFIRLHHYQQVPAAGLRGCGAGQGRAGPGRAGTQPRGVAHEATARARVVCPNPAGRSSPRLLRERPSACQGALRGRTRAAKPRSRPTRPRTRACCTLPRTRTR